MGVCSPVAFKLFSSFCSAWGSGLFVRLERKELRDDSRTRALARRGWPALPATASTPVGVNTGN